MKSVFVSVSAFVLAAWASSFANAQERIVLPEPSLNRAAVGIGIQHNFGGIAAQNNVSATGSLRFDYGHSPNTVDGSSARLRVRATGGVPTNNARSVLASQSLSYWLAFSRNAEWGGYGLTIGEESSLSPLSVIPVLANVGLCATSAFDRSRSTREQGLFFVCIQGLAGARSERHVSDYGFALGFGLNSMVSIPSRRLGSPINIEANVRIIQFSNQLSASRPADGNAILETQIELAVPVSQSRRLWEAFLQFHSEHMIVFGGSTRGSVMPVTGSSGRMDTGTVDASVGLQTQY